MGSGIYTVFDDQHELLRAVAQLYTGGTFDLDPTYSNGAFYRRGVPVPRLKYDLAPKRPDVLQADCRALPLPDASVRSVVFDPPFNHAPGKASIMAQRFGGYRSQAEHQALYAAALAEFARILEPGGVVVFKCQDIVESGKQVWNHTFVQQAAETRGFVAQDCLILHRAGKVRGHNWGNQQHAWRTHSYFWVFTKGEASQAQQDSCCLTATPSKEEPDYGSRTSLHAAPRRDLLPREHAWAGAGW